MHKKLGKIIRRWRLEYALSSLTDQQTGIDRVLAQAEEELKSMRDKHKARTDQLAAQRTSIRTQLIRL